MNLLPTIVLKATRLTPTKSRSTNVLRAMTTSYDIIRDFKITKHLKHCLSRLDQQ